MAFPETPLLIYPSLAKRYGVEAALLYGMCHQLMIEASFDPKLAQQNESEPFFFVSSARWSAITNFWTSERVLELSGYLSQQKLFTIDIQGNYIAITFLEHDKGVMVDNSQSSTDIVVPIANSMILDKAAPIEAAPAVNTDQIIQNTVASFQLPQKEEIIENTQTLPVYDVPPAPPTRPLPKWQERAGEVKSKQIAPSHQPASVITDNTAISTTATIGNNALRNKGPAPSFGGSTGWKKRSNDAFQNLLERQEQLSKQLHSMTMDWKPSQMFYSSLVRSNIPQQYADNCLDEFILFYSDKNTKERSWDQKFLAWVKRGWVKQQGNDNKVHSTTQNTGVNHENSQRDTREKRKRITAAIMDINDTNW